MEICVDIGSENFKKLLAILTEGRKKDQIIIVYEGVLSEDELLSALKKRVPEYMMPSVYKKLAALPHNSNGKIDRALLKKEYCTQ